METLTVTQAKVIKDLLQLDIDAVEAYQQALKKIDDTDIHSTISSFCNDHETHIQKLTAILNEEKCVFPKRAKDFKGFIIKGFTAIRSLTGTIGALNAMQTNEELTNKKYAAAANIDFSENIKLVIEKNLEDEKRHLSYINQILKKTKL